MLPALAAAGYECYALSLRGQGGSDLGESVAEVAAHQGGVPLDVNVGDIAAFVATLPAPPVLVGHSLGGMFVQVGTGGVRGRVRGVKWWCLRRGSGGATG